MQYTRNFKFQGLHGTPTAVFIKNLWYPHTRGANTRLYIRYMRTPETEFPTE
jgi:hypothetical protein